MLSNKLVVGIFAWSASVCAQAVPTSIPTDKPVAFSSGLNVLDTSNGGLNSLPKPSYTIKQWPWGTLPKNCYDLAVNPNEGRCAPTDVEVYDVTYSDVRITHYPHSAP